MQSNPLSKNIFVPVVKRPRRELRIPRIDAHARLLAQRREEERIRAVREGTTPQGREVLRQIIFRAERLLEKENLPDEQIVNAIVGELETFLMLRPEFLLLLSRVWGPGFDKLYNASARLIAKLMLFKIKLDQQRRRTNQQVSPAC